MKNDIKNIIDKYDDDIVDGVKKIIKTKGYDRQMVKKIESKIKSSYPKSYCSDIIKKPLSVPVLGTNINKALYTQYWSILDSSHVYTFMISYGPNTGVLVGFKELAVSFFMYPSDIIEKTMSWCDEGYNLTFKKDKIISIGLDGAELVNNTLYDKLEKYIKEKHSKLQYRRSIKGIIFK